MGYEIKFTGPEGNDGPFSLASSGGWADVCDWVDQLPSINTDSIKGLTTDGKWTGTDQLVEELDQALVMNHPSMGVYHTCVDLLDNIGVGDSEETALVIGGDGDDSDEEITGNAREISHPAITEYLNSTTSDSSTHTPITQNAKTGKKPTPSQIDPTNTATLRRGLSQQLKNRFTELKRRIRKLVVDEDCFGLSPRSHDPFALHPTLNTALELDLVSTQMSVNSSFFEDCERDEHGWCQPGSGSKTIRAIDAVKKWKAKVGGSLTEFIDSKPGGKWVRTKLASIKPGMEARYGKKTALAIVGAANAISWGAFAIGPLVGHPNYIPASGLMLAGAVLAESYLQASRAGKAVKSLLTKNESDLTEEQIEEQAHWLVRQLAMTVVDNEATDPILNWCNQFGGDSCHGLAGKAATKSAKWVAKKVGDAYKKFSDRYGKAGAIAMLGAMAVTLPLPGNVLGVIAAAEGIKAGVGLGKKLLSRPTANAGVYSPNYDIDAMVQEMVDWADQLGLGGDSDILRGKLETELNNRLSATTNALNVFDYPGTLSWEERQQYPQYDYTPVANTRFAFQSNPQKLKAFQAWLKQQVGSLFASKTEQQMMEEYAKQGFAKGAGKAFDDVTVKQKASLATDEEQFAYAGGKEQFLKSAFGRPVAVERIEVLASRSFDELENISADTSTKITRALTDGLVQGKGARQLANDLDDATNVGASRAEAMARVEIVRSHAEGQLETMEMMGVDDLGVQAEYSTAGDGQVCPKCTAMQGKTFSVAEARGIIPLHVNCRCSWIPSVPGMNDEPTVNEVWLIENAAWDSSKHPRNAHGEFMTVGEVIKTVDKTQKALEKHQESSKKKTADFNQKIKDAKTELRTKKKSGTERQQVSASNKITKLESQKAAHVLGSKNKESLLKSQLKMAKMGVTQAKRKEENDAKEAAKRAKEAEKAAKLKVKTVKPTKPVRVVKPKPVVIPTVYPQSKEEPNDGRRVSGSGDEGRGGKTGREPSVTSGDVEKATARPSNTKRDQDGSNGGESASSGLAKVVPTTVEKANRKIDRMGDFFRKNGQHEVAGWLDQLKDHISNVGTEEALKSLGEDIGSGDSKVTQYEGKSDDISAFAEAYLNRHGIVPIAPGEESEQDQRLISAQSPSYGPQSRPDPYLAGDFNPANPTFKDKLVESQHLPGLESSEDINKIVGKPVTHLTPEVMAKFDEKYGKGKWIVKTYGENAFAGNGIFFPQRAAQIPQDAKNTLWTSGQELAKHGFTHLRNKSGQVVGIKHKNGDEYKFGTDKYDSTIFGDARHWADQAMNAAPNEHAAALPFGGKEFMAQPAFNVVGISEADRAAGVTIKYGQEGRVHITTKGGKASVVPHSTWLKGEHLPVVFENDDTKAMAQAAVNAINSLPESERKGQIYAPDIVKTDQGYKVVEANPANETGSSGYLSDNPFIIDSYVSHLTNRSPAHVRFIRKLLSAKQ